MRKALIIGCGKIAGGYNAGPGDTLVLSHACAYSQSPNYELVGCVEPDAERRATFMNIWNVPEGFATLDEALDARSYDIVSICSPTGTHLDALERILAADVRAVFAEKPLDGNTKRAHALAEQFTRKGVPVSVNFTRRFDLTMRRLRQEIATGRFGDLGYVTGAYDHGLLNCGTHLIDAALFLTGRSARLLHAGLDFPTDIPGDINISAVLDLEGAAMHVMCGSESAVRRFEIELAFSDAIINVEDGGLTLRMRRPEPSRFFPNTVEFERGTWSQTGFGTAMLDALAELAAWQPNIRLASDIYSACESIALVNEIRARGSEPVRDVSK